jgi:DNA-binding MarR family transcriptional regulator
MKEDKMVKQAEALNQAFHNILFSVMFARPDSQSTEVQKLSFIEMHLIGLAGKQPDLIIKELRQYLKVPQTTLSSIIAKLEKTGLVRRVINNRDMRSFSLKITAKGKKIREAHEQADLKQAQGALLALTETERDIFIELLQKVGEALKSSGSLDTKGRKK